MAGRLSAHVAPRVGCGSAFRQIFTRNLPKAYRLQQAGQFTAVFAFNCYAGGDSFVVLAKPNGLHHPRLGLVASKKVASRAVDRNYFRRQAREIFRLNQHTLGGIDVVIKLRKIFRSESATQKRAQLLQLLLKLEKCRA